MGTISLSALLSLVALCGIIWQRISFGWQIDFLKENLGKPEPDDVLEKVIKFTQYELEKTTKQILKAASREKLPNIPPNSFSNAYEKSNEKDPLSISWDRSDKFFDPSLSAIKDSHPDIDKTPANVQSFIELWKETETKGYQCKDLRHLGADGKPGSEGAWSTCFDTFNLKKKKLPCRIFSFGINHDFSFEDRITQTTRCKLDAFDPSMGISNHERDDYISFWNWGLYDSYNEQLVGMDVHTAQEVQGTWKVNSLKGLMSALEVDHLDFLKIDIEYYEWTSLDQALKDDVLSRVDVLMFEFHLEPARDPNWDAMMMLEKDEDGEYIQKEEKEPPKPKKPVEYMSQRCVEHKTDIFRRLRRLGFKQYWSHVNPESFGSAVKGADFQMYAFFPERFPCCAELGFIRTGGDVGAKLKFLGE